MVVPSPADVGGLRSRPLCTIWAPMFSNLILELDLLGDRYAVLGDHWRAETLLENHVAALGTERDFDRISELVDAGTHLVARRVRKNDLFYTHGCLPDRWSCRYSRRYSRRYLCRYSVR